MDDLGRLAAADGKSINVLGSQNDLQIGVGERRAVLE